MRSNIIKETMLKTTTGADDLRARRGSDQEAIKERERGSHKEDHTQSSGFRVRTDY